MRFIEPARDKELQEIEKELLQFPLLKLDKLDVIDGDNTEVLYTILKENSNRDTYSINVSNRVQCRRNLNRGQQDLFLLMRFYRPEITFKEFRQCILNLINDKKILTLKCSDVGDKVFHIDLMKYGGGGDPYPGLYHKELQDRWGYTLKRSII